MEEEKWREKGKKKSKRRGSRVKKKSWSCPFSHDIRSGDHKQKKKMPCVCVLYRTPRKTIIKKMRIGTGILNNNKDSRF